MRLGRILQENIKSLTAAKFEGVLAMMEVITQPKGNRVFAKGNRVFAKGNRVFS